MNEQEKKIVTKIVDTKTPKPVEPKTPTELNSKAKPTGSNIPKELLPENFNPFNQERSFGKKNMQPKRRNFQQQTPEFEERVIKIKRVIKVTKGGRQFRFSALVVVGNKKGKVGFATAKSIEVPNAIKKAVRLAKDNLFNVKIVGEQATIAHEIIGKHGAAKVLLKPAKSGKGIITSDVIRSVVELAGYKNIYSKNLGTNNPQNVIIATIDGLLEIRTKEEIFKLRDKPLALSNKI